MNKRTTGILLTITTVFLCACPGSCLFMLVGMEGVVYFNPDAAQSILSIWELAGMVFFGSALVAVPILIALAFFAPLPLRLPPRKPQPSGKFDDEPIPPAI